MDIAAETKKKVSALFSDVEEEEIEQISELPGITDELIEVLKNNNIELIETLVSIRIRTFLH